MLLINILLFVLIVLRLLIGMRLFSTAHSSRMNNLYWLALMFFVSAITLPFTPTTGNPLGGIPASPWLNQAVNIPLTQSSLIMFVHTTFYSDRKSPAGWFVGVTALAIVILWYGIAISPSGNLHPFVAATSVILAINWTWQAWAGYAAWRNVARERAVEDWVKTRYKLVVWGSVFQVVYSLPVFVLIAFLRGDLSGPLGLALSATALTCNIANVVLQYFAWAAPASFYRWLNHKYQPPKYDEMTEEQVMHQMASKG